MVVKWLIVYIFQAIDRIKETQVVVDKSDPEYVLQNHSQCPRVDF